MVKLGMLHLEYGFDQEAFRVPVVADHPEHFAYDAAARLTLDMSPKIDGLSDLCFGVGEGGLRMIADNQIGEAMEGLFRGVGMDRGQRSGVAGIEGIEHRSPFDSTDFAEDDPVRTPAQSRL